MIRVAIADDQPLIRTGFATLIGQATDMVLVGEAEDGAEAVVIAREEVPDVLLMDIRMPRLDGIEATRRIAADETTGLVRVVILTTFDLDEHVHDALRAGASGFLLKEMAPEELLAAIRVVAAGDALLAPSVTRRLIAQFAGRAGPALLDPERLSHLTDREREVVQLVGRGLSNDEIAEELFISPATAKTHVSHAMTKLGARDRAQLVVAAYEGGLVIPGS